MFELLFVIYLAPLIAGMAIGTLAWLVDKNQNLESILLFICVCAVPVLNWFIVLLVVTVMLQKIYNHEN